jgi:nitrogen fixation/metabolism regulation signal transduction histidine kinase
VVSAQRSQAWAEVAQRLAHEIKNPLTPIQLSAQRLERRLTGKLADADALVLEKSVKTIVQQVDAMKNLVNEFREYARLPVAKMQAIDLNSLILDITSLYKEEGISSKGDTIELDLDQNCVPILGDSGQLRQVVHNLLQNAQDACEIKFPGCILLQTKFNSVTRRVRLVVTDHGTGFAEHILARAFEPYVTTKSHGTGLGLAVVKKIADDHGARLELSNKWVGGKVEGAQVLLSFATEENVAHEMAQSGN